MANVDKPSGFRPIRYLNGAPYNGAVTKYVFPAADATNSFIGDVVKITSIGDATTGLRSIAVCASTEAAVGVLVGLEADPTNLNTPVYRAASTRRVAYVADDPNLLFVVQEDGDTDPLEMVDAGLNVNLLATEGSTVTGQSAMEINSNTESTVATLPLKLVEPLQSPDNELASAGNAYTRWVVKINNHQLGSHTGTIGV